MNGSADKASGQTNAVAFVITHAINPGETVAYETWLNQILAAVSNFPGYLGREIFRPAHGKNKYTIIVRFDTQAHLQAWADSSERKSYIERAHHLLENGDVHEIRTGIDFWFTPEGMKPPKSWKQFLLTVSAVYPLSLIIPRLLDYLSNVFPIIHNPYVKGFLVAASLTAMLTFVVMPRYTRLMKRWLYDESS